jgi:hypothetical protein
MLCAAIRPARFQRLVTYPNLRVIRWFTRHNPYDLHYEKSLHHLTRPEIKDDNALGDAPANDGICDGFRLVIRFVDPFEVQ